MAATNHDKYPAVALEQADHLTDLHAVTISNTSILVRVLYPVVPHLGHALWQALGLSDEFGDLLDARWPQVDEDALVQDEIELVLQINGKVRGSVRVPAQPDQAAIQAAATATEAWARHAEGRTPRKVVVVPGRLVNLVV